MSSAENNLVVEFCKGKLIQLYDNQEYFLHMVLSIPEPVPLEIGEILEDIANLYLDASETISVRHLLARQEGRASQLETVSEPLVVD